jgi:sugar transferase (PEP-CTERM system associated)
MIRIFSQYVSPKRLLLIGLETVLIAFSLLLGARLRFLNQADEFTNYVRWPDFSLQILVVVVVLQICFYYSDLYDVSVLRRHHQLVICLAESLGAACLVLGGMYYIFPGLLLDHGIFFISVSLVAVITLTNRLALDHTWRFASRKEHVLLFGTGELAVTVAREFSRRDDLNIELAGFVETDESHGDKQLFGHPILGSADQLDMLVAAHRITRIVVALEDFRGVLPVRALVRLRVQGIRIEDAHSIISALNGRVWLSAVKPSWFVFSDGFHRSRMTMLVKRVGDLAFSIMGLLVSLPIMLLLALAIRLESSGPVIFRQSRVGLRGKTFELLKFRSMRADAEQGTGAQWAQVNDPRVTRLGKYLRKFRLDELPQFVNIIRGEMGFVGPRPERPVFVDRLRQKISYYDERHSVRPGLTGWAQVQYPYGASEEDAARKLEYDLFYLKNMSIFFDCAIILQTVRHVCKGNGAR